MSSQLARLTVSIPRSLFRFATELAEEKQTSRSKIVSECLEQFARRRFEAEMIEGYKAMAEERRQFAELSFEAAREVVPDWD